MNHILIANLLSILSGVFICTSSFFKKKNSILTAQALECCSSGCAQIFAHSYAAAIELFLCAIRNIVAAREPDRKWIYWVFSCVFAAMGLIYNNRGWIGMLAIAATVQFTLWTGYAKNAQAIRYGMCINLILWIIHDYIVHMYVSVGIMSFSVAVIIANIVQYKREATVLASLSANTQTDR